MRLDLGERVIMWLGVICGACVLAFGLLALRDFGLSGIGLAMFACPIGLFVIFVCGKILTDDSAEHTS